MSSLEETIADAVAERVAALVVERLASHLHDPCFTPTEAATYLGISRRTLAALDIPRVHPTPGMNRYLLSDLRNHLRNRNA